MEINNQSAVVMKTPVMLEQTVGTRVQVQETKEAEKKIATDTYNDKSNEQSKGELQEKTIIEAIEKANKKLISANTNLEFSIHERTKQIMIKVVDKETDEVIKEIPSEKALDMLASMCESAGLLVDEKI